MSKMAKTRQIVLENDVGFGGPLRPRDCIKKIAAELEMLEVTASNYFYKSRAYLTRNTTIQTVPVA